MTHEPEKVQAILQQAKEIMAKRGLAKGRRIKGRDGAVCARGALGLAIRNDPYLRKGNSLMRDCERAMGFGFWRQVPAWNDQPERTKNQVLARFEQGIAAMEDLINSRRLDLLTEALGPPPEPPEARPECSPRLGRPRQSTASKHPRREKELA